ncbi:MAG TPA: phosphoribosylformylglycinamidine synthase subunit PurS, partial [Candidatus Limnocylindrales bacterium]|nr:phosphoribosylformylglycinamidine synthase subunit PurS [Candidatus Limnocylindrales bacterium]
QGRAVESSLGHLGIDGVSDVRVGRRVELTVSATDDAVARAVVERLATELLANPLIESFDVDVLGATSSRTGVPAGAAS